jgi:hypothetical protein
MFIMAVKQDTVTLELCSSDAERELDGVSTVCYISACVD